MWRKIFAGIRYYSTKILGALFTLLANVVCGVKKTVETTSSALKTGATWVAEQCKPVPVAHLSKVAMLRAFVLFVGGFVCCFLFPEDAKGDLTWFEKMLTSAMDWTSYVMRETKDRVMEWALTKYRRIVVT